jgi:hypothetical protein
MWAGGVREMGFSGAIVSCRNCPGKPWIQSQTPIEELARLLICWQLYVTIPVWVVTTLTSGDWRFSMASGGLFEHAGTLKR